MLVGNDVQRNPTTAPIGVSPMAQLNNYAGMAKLANARDQGLS